MTIELKNIRIVHVMSEETTCFSAKLYVNGRKAADVDNSGKGGSHRYHWWDRTAEDAIAQYAANKGMKNYGTFEAPYDTDTLVDELLEQYEIRKLCKKSIVYRVPGDELGVWRILKTQSRPEAVLYIERKHPSAKYEILNDQLLS